ncbi:separin [Anopheles bellator]|uniref:separin n=1 Tax=Anopheles bellator TaxID=139047 RepID=UPI002649A80A|nr:separin [Anopheles bellator]
MPSSLKSIQHSTGLMNLDLKLRASEALAAGDERAAIFLQTQSLGASKRLQYSQQYRQCKDIGESIDSITKGLKKQSESREASIAAEYDKLCKACRELPEQWTVIQISKAFNPRSTSLTYEENLQAPAPVWLTVFRCSDPVDEARSEPLLVCLDPPADEPGLKFESFFEHITSIAREVRNGISAEANSAGGTKGIRNEAMEEMIASSIDRVKRWLGPWTNMLCGKFRSQADQSLEAEIYNRIEDYCIQHRMNKKAQRLLSLVARRLDLLEGFDVYRLCCSMELDLDDSAIGSLYDFLIDIKAHKFNSKPKQSECYPVVLIVDEWLDGFPWEMLHPANEFCRFGSFCQLDELFRVHKKRIKNGYLCVRAQNCCAIINPDKNLEKMSLRLQMFYREWYPDFQLLVDQPPTESEFVEMLDQSDVVCYNGHGSGMQFMNGETLLQRDINCVTFLFGCDSVRLYSNGLFTELLGSHLYYNAARCPALIGALWVLTDLYTDIYSILLFGNWIPSTNPKYSKQNISNLDTVALKAMNWQFNKTTKYFIPQSPNLLKLMSECRLFLCLPQRIRCAFVCRGLPIMNETHNQKANIN